MNIADYFFSKGEDGHIDDVRTGNAIKTVLVLLATIILMSEVVFVTPEGYIDVITKFGKADRQVSPGLHFKWPFIEDVEGIEVRQRKNTEELTAATKNQLAITTKVSINWTVNKESAMDIFIKYGGLEQFEKRILDPKLRSVTKAALARFPADELIRNRNAAVGKILEGMRSTMESFPVVVNSPQIENVTFPEEYAKAVLDKEKAREAAEREKHNLARQQLEAQQKVNTANAERDAKKALADGEAYRLLTEAEAEARAIELINEQLEKSPRYVELIRARRWDGALPETLITEGSSGLLMHIGGDDRSKN